MELMVTTRMDKGTTLCLLEGRFGVEHHRRCILGTTWTWGSYVERG